MIRSAGGEQSPVIRPVAGDGPAAPADTRLVPYRVTSSFLRGRGKPVHLRADKRSSNGRREDRLRAEIDQGCWATGVGSGSEWRDGRAARGT